MVLHFEYPLAPSPRVAIVGVPVAGGPGPNLIEAETLAAPARTLLKLNIPGWEPIYPVVAFTGSEYGFLTEQDRTRIWNRWGVPVFEQLLSADLRVIAEECDAHDGLHVRIPDCAIQHGELHLEVRPTGIAAMLLTSPCPCGTPGPRLVDVGYCFSSGTLTSVGAMAASA